MAKTVNVNFKLDAEDKKKMEEACAEMGLSMSAAFTIFAKTVGREHRIPFEVAADPFYSEANMERLKKSVQQIEETCQNTGAEELTPQTESYIKSTEAS